MNDSRRERLYNNLLTKDTKDLLEIWQNDDTDDWEKEVFDIIKEILVERLGSLPPQSIEIQISQILDKVEEHLENRAFDRALSECEIAIQMNPEFAIPYNFLGVIYDGMGQPENALASYQKAIQLDPELKDAWENMLGAEAEIKKEFEESTAKLHLDQALEYAYNDEPENVLAECELAKLSMPDIAVAYNYHGLILQTANQLELAIDSYLKAIQLNPRFYAARENLANARVRWEEEQYRLFSNLGPIDAQETILELDESQFPESDELTPQWLYMDETAFLLVGWAGYRTRQGRSGYDPLENDFELSRMEGVVIRLLLTRKFRTQNPIYLILMVYLGVSFLFSGGLPILLGGLNGILVAILYSPYFIVGITLLINVYLSLRIKKSGEYEDNGNTFF